MLRNRIIIILMVLANTLTAQDKIVTKDGSKIMAKIIEVGDDLIKYKKLENLDGPLYIVKLSNIVLIEYENGSIDIFDRRKAAIVQDSIPVVEPIQLQGPRFGVLMTGDQIFTNVGWQEEYIFFTAENGFSIVGETIGLVAGIEQNRFLPSLSFILGFRDRRGLEFGIGPNLSLSGTAFAFAIGVTGRGKKINVPFNVAVVPSDGGMRFSILTGFNFRKR